MQLSCFDTPFIRRAVIMCDCCLSVFLRGWEHNYCILTVFSLLLWRAVIMSDRCLSEQLGMQPWCFDCFPTVSKQGSNHVSLSSLEHNYCILTVFSLSLRKTVVMCDHCLSVSLSVSQRFSVSFSLSLSLSVSLSV